MRDSKAIWSALDMGRKSRTTRKSDSAWETPVLPVLSYEDGVRPSLSSCLCHNITYCHNNFAGEGMRACIHGMLLNSDLLPVGVAGGIMDVEGGFSAGLDLPICTHLSQTADVIPHES